MRFLPALFQDPIIGWVSDILVCYRDLVLKLALVLGLIAVILLVLLVVG